MGPQYRRTAQALRQLPYTLLEYPAGLAIAWPAQEAEGEEVSGYISRRRAKIHEHLRRLARIDWWKAAKDIPLHDLERVWTLLETADTITRAAAQPALKKGKK